MKHVSICRLILPVVVFLVLLSAIGLIDVAIAAEGSSSTTAPGLSSMFSGDESMATRSARMIGGLLLCLGVFALGVRLLNKQGMSRRSGSLRRLEIREKLAISSKASIFLVALDDKEFLVASGSDSINILQTRSTSSEVFAESLRELGEVPEAFNA